MLDSMRQATGYRRGRWLKTALVAIALALPASTATAQDLWSILVTNTDGMGIPDLTVGGSNLPDLINNLIDSAGAFASFTGTAFSADVSFAGISNVINITVDPVTATGTLTFTILGAGAQTFVFTGANLQAQIEQFIQDNIADQLTAFLNQINQLSLIAVTDGTPMSSTSLAATYVFDRFALHADLTMAERRAADTQEFKEGLRGRIDTYYDSISTDVGNGNSVAFAVSLEYAIDKTTSVAVLIPVAYHEIEGSDIVNVQGTVAVPINVITPTETSPLGLRVVPFGTLAASGSVDLIAGGLIGSAGVLATVLLDWDTVTLSFSSQISYHDSITLRYQGFEFDPNISQEIFKNGLKATFRQGDHFYVYGAGVFTQFLQDAAVDSFWTAEFGVGFRMANNPNIVVGYSGDFADGYPSDGARAMFQLPF